VAKILHFRRPDKTVETDYGHMSEAEAFDLWQVQIQAFSQAFSNNKRSQKRALAALDKPARWIDQRHRRAMAARRLT